MFKKILRKLCVNRVSLILSRKMSNKQQLKFDIFDQNMSADCTELCRILVQVFTNERVFIFQG